MAQEMSVEVTCPHCSGTGVYGGLTCACCNGSGTSHYHAGIYLANARLLEMHRLLEDFVDKLNDILDKCNDIFEKVNE